jgi:hypothetical protein
MWDKQPMVSQFEDFAGKQLAATKEISRSNLSGADWVVGQSPKGILCPGD